MVAMTVAARVAAKEEAVTAVALEEEVKVGG